MKLKIYLIIAFLGILFSCAEEGPFIIGKLECFAELSLRTPTTAVVTLNIPENRDNVIIMESEKHQVFLCKNGSQIKDDWEVEGYIKQIENGGIQAFFYGLTPNTSYDCYLRCNVDYNLDNQNDGWRDYYLIDSFFTSKVDDYSDFGSKIKCEAVSLSDSLEEVAIKITLPCEWYLDDYGKLYASESPNMTDAVVSQRFIKDIKNTDYTNNSSYTFYFSKFKMDSKEYFLELQGSISNSNRYLESWEYSNATINNVKIRIPKSIDLSMVQ